MRIIFSDEKMMRNAIVCFKVDGCKMLTVGFPSAPQIPDWFVKKINLFILNLVVKKEI